MTIYQNKIREFMEEYWNSHTPDICHIHSIFSEKVIIDSPISTNVGKPKMIDTNVTWMSAFPNLTLSNIEYVASDSRVVSTWNSTATNEEPFLGYAPTNKHIYYTGMTFFDFADDKIVRYKCQINMFDIYQQLGFVMVKEKYPSQHTMKHRLVDLYKYLKSLMPTLTKRELQCVAFFVTGSSAKVIGQQLNISFRTAQVHISNAMQKLDVHTKHSLKEKFYADNVYYIIEDVVDNERNS